MKFLSLIFALYAAAAPQHAGHKPHTQVETVPDSSLADIGFLARTIYRVGDEHYYIAAKETSYSANSSKYNFLTLDKETVHNGINNCVFIAKSSKGTYLSTSLQHDLTHAFHLSLNKIPNLTYYAITPKTGGSKLEVLLGDSEPVVVNCALGIKKGTSLLVLSGHGLH